jgi:ribosomal protein S18 acetylase RimI-like enzyme
MDDTADRRLLTRALSGADAPSLLALVAAMDELWWGQVESDLDDIEEHLDHLGTALGSRSLAVLDGERLLGAVTVREDRCAEPVVDPSLEVETREHVLDLLLAAALEIGTDEVSYPDGDDLLGPAVRRNGFAPAYRSFELERPPTAPDAVPFPAGATVRPFDRDRHAPALHEAIYTVWAEVPGHHHRAYDDWFGLFLGSERAPDDLQVVAWAGTEVVGAAVCRTYPPATGWVAQLAVTSPWRGRGLGRALLVEACRRLAAIDGLGDIGLAVMASNERALGLYHQVGFQVTRAWVVARRDEPTG